MPNPVSVRKRKTDKNGVQKKNDQTSQLASVKEPSQHRCVRCFWRALDILKWVALLVILPPLLNYVSLKNEHTALLPQDALLYNVGQDQNLMLRCSGRGAPTVILESPGGISSDIWTDVGRRLAKISRVCMYDRAGIGFSARPSQPSPPLQDGETASAATPNLRSQEFTVERMADDLKRLVSEASSQPQPFILVGLELGTLLSRFYSHMFDGQISHVYLVDPLSSALFSNKIWHEYWRSNVLHATQSKQMLGALGINRLALVTGVSELPVFWSQISDGNVTARQMHLSCHPKHLKSGVDELAGVLDSLQQIKTLSTVKPFPKAINYTVLYRHTYDRNISEEVNVIWREAMGSIAGGLHIPTDQVEIIETNSSSIYESISDRRLTKLIESIRSKVNDYRKGKTKSE